MLTDTQFVDIWQTSDGAKEVQEKTGMSIKAIYKRVFRYRKRGIPLKRFRNNTALLIERARRLERVNS